MARRRSPLALTADLVALVERTEPDSGPEEGLTPLTDADYERAADDLLAANPEGPFWLFAYGSLIWKPDFEHVEQVTARAHGWRRSFCLDMVRWRATREQPGLMMALARGGSCTGVAYRLPEGEAPARMVRLLKRETSHHQDLPSVRWLDVRAGGRRLKALTFWAAPCGPGYFIDLPIEDQAHRLARAAGHVGSCAAYLHNTVAKLDSLGIHDRYLWRLQALVADEIRRMHGHGG